MKVGGRVESGAVRAIRDAVSGTEFEGRLFLVGGCVRDALLGRKGSVDLDIVVEGDALALATLLQTRGVATGGIEVYARFGTAQVTVDGQKVELATARKESYSPDSRKPQVAPASLLEDARRRDFTVNTLLADIRDGQVVDLLGTGLHDLQAGVLRTPVDPALTFSDDPLRMLRAVRFRHRLGFEFGPGLVDAMRAEAPRVSILSRERIRDEFSHMVAAESAPGALQDLLETGLLAEFGPEIVAMVGCGQGGPNDLDVWGHTMQVLGHASGCDLPTKLACLLHGVGKPLTRTTDASGTVHFFGQETVAEKTAAEFLGRLRFDSETVRQVCLLVRNHTRLASVPEISDAVARRILYDLGPDLERWLGLVEACSKSPGGAASALDIGVVRSRLGEVSAASPLAVLDSPLGGDEIMAALGLAPGRDVRRYKELLREAVLDGAIPAGDKAAALGLLAELGKNPGHRASVSENSDGSKDQD